MGWRAGEGWDGQGAQNEGGTQGYVHLSLGEGRAGGFCLWAFFFFFCKSLGERVAAGRHGRWRWGSMEVGRAGAEVEEETRAGSQEQCISSCFETQSRVNPKDRHGVVSGFSLSGKNTLALSAHGWKMKCEVSQRRGDRAVSCLRLGMTAQGLRLSVPAQGRQLKKTPGCARPHCPKTSKQNQN